MRPPLNRLGGDYYRLSIMAVIELKSSKVTIALGKLSIVNKNTQDKYTEVRRMIQITQTREYPDTQIEMSYSRHISTVRCSREGLIICGLARRCPVSGSYRS